MVTWIVFLWASFDIRQIDYGTMGAEVWPRGIVILLIVLTAIYLFQSLRAGADAKRLTSRSPIKGWFTKYRNPLWCYALYFLFC